MSYPVQRPAQHASSETSATTSSIHEYTCLFTHDLKRKSKRWQDGRLRHHVFNNRIMVYDDGGASIGDAHLPSSDATLKEGDEINLDRGGAIVQVGEMLGKKEVDLASLVDKRMREVEKRRKEAAEKPGRAGAGVVTVQRPQQQQQRPLSSIMHTPARIGRAAIPRESPYEQRLQREAAETVGEELPPPAKRRKRSVSPPSKMGHARALFGTQLTLSARPTSSWSQRSQVLRDRTNVLSSSAENEAGRGGDNDVVVVEKPTTRLKNNVGRERAADPPERDMPASSLANADDHAEEREPKPVKRIASAVQIRAQGLPSLLSSVRKPELDDQKPTASRRKLTASAVVAIGSSNDEDEPRPRALATPHPEQSVPLSHSKQTVSRKSKESKKKSTILEIERCKDLPPTRESSDELRSRATNTGVEKTKPTKTVQESCERQQSPNQPGLGEPETSKGRRDGQQRTELRIRSRKKRGLLMLSERASGTDDQPRELSEVATKEVSNKSPIPEDQYSPGFEEWLAESLSVKGATAERGGSPPECLSPNAEKEALEVAQTKHSKPTLDDSGSAQEIIADTAAATREPADSRSSTTEGSRSRPVSRHNESPGGVGPADHGGASDDTIDKLPAKSRRRRREREPSPVVSNEDPDAYRYQHSEESESDDWNGPPPSRPAARKQQQNQKSERPSKTAEKLQINRGPRLSRINKSCRSKEIIGFPIPGSGPAVPGSFASTASLLSRAAGSATVAATTPEPAPAQPQEPSSNDPVGHEGDEDKTKPARVANPATRGRKAASKADAAGMALHTAVPFDIVSAPVAPVMAAPRPEPLKEAASLPGFSKANGGAWSRHAEDLLGMVRPKKVSKR